MVASYGIWIYAILFAIVFSETGLVVAPFLPGDSLLFIAGALAASGGMDPWLLSLVLIVAAVLGNTANYWIGRWVGPRVFHWEQSRWFNRRALDQAHGFYEQYGGITITVGRFMPFARTFVPFVGGVAAMSHSVFQVWNVLGAVLWVASFVGLGFFFGNMPVVKNNLVLIMLAVVVLSFLPLFYTWLVRRLRKPAGKA